MAEHPTFRGPILNQCEIYPRRRTTEFYKTPGPRASSQSRRAEHPRDILNKVPSRNRETARQLPRIQPPNNSDSSVLRNGYFS
ncbi:uncharacterized protein LOC108100243 [Drosophila ficusphila]|uniref:uncharacterized protein LOC108100243 n=1 Tax=Drosophila ficusphila TaxID=30025 RepID=UPI0007E7C3F3|nr:uncharacterized protein LOC108100243 [Drosophila ficusphila]